ncbi:MAG: hypothetical protein ACX939_01410 [Hyphococcus sp.]
MAAPTPKPAYRDVSTTDRMRRKFRRQDEARYRVKDRLAKPPADG